MVGQLLGQGGVSWAIRDVMNEDPDLASRAERRRAGRRLR
jgi:hypothetical protein